MDGLRAGISKQGRALPVRNIRSGAAEKSATKADIQYVAEQLAQFALLIELEDMENDRAGDSVFAYGFEI